MNRKRTNDLRLIEAGFPCHQVGAETQRERDTGKAPPTHRIHVWWARRPLTPSRAAILASLLPADTDPDWFLRRLGIEKRVVEINGQQWTLTGKILERVKRRDDGEEVLEVDERVLQELEKENKTREELRLFLRDCEKLESFYGFSETLEKWSEEVAPLKEPAIGETLRVARIAADPAWANEKKALGRAAGYRFPGDPYGYTRAFENVNSDHFTRKKLVILDPTAGGGSIPFEALRLGHDVVANELNPVATVILHATLDYNLDGQFHNRHSIRIRRS